MFVAEAYQLLVQTRHLGLVLQHLEGASRV